jgi:hypothetical protein
MLGIIRGGPPSRRVDRQTRPAGKTEAFFELVWGLARDGKVNQNGRPNLLQSAVSTWKQPHASMDWPAPTRTAARSAPPGAVLGGQCRRVGCLPAGEQFLAPIALDGVIADMT